jgi:hypothetical protein
LNVSFWLGDSVVTPTGNLASGGSLLEAAFIVVPLLVVCAVLIVVGQLRRR